MTSAHSGWARPMVALIVLASLSAGIFWWQTRPATEDVASPAPRVPVRVTTVQRQDVAHFSTGIGSVEPLNRVTIRPQIDGQLTAVHVQEGQLVRAGDLLATLDDRAIQAALKLAEAQKRQAEAQLASARLELTRFQDLAKRQAIARQQLEQQETLVAQMQAAVHASDAAITAERVRLSYARITSPLSGRVGLRNIDAGNYVRTTDAAGLFTVTQISPVSVIFSLPQQQLPQLKKLLQENTAATVEAYERDGRQKLAQGQLLMMDSAVDSNTGTVRLRAEFDNEDTQLWPGQLVSVRLQTGMSRDSLTLPAGAVRMGLEQEYVYRVQGESVEVVPVKRIHDENGLSIIEGVDAGDTVVTDGFTRLKAGSSVEIVEPEVGHQEQAQADHTHASGVSP